MGMDIGQSRGIVERYLRRCVTYSDASIERKIARGEDAAEIARWQAYREFTAYSAEEISAGVLDSWLTDDDFDSQPGSSPLLGGETVSIDLAGLDHTSRRNWLAGLLMPRPVVLIATTSRSGVENLAPMSSVNVVSNSPALLALALSVDIEDRPRDTLVNLREAGVGAAATIFVLPADYDSAQAVVDTAAPLSEEESEWDLVNGEPPLLTGALAAIDCSLVELHPLPAGASGTLVILSANSILIPDGVGSDSLPSKLFQIDFNSLGPGPDERAWRHNLNSPD